MLVTWPCQRHCTLKWRRCLLGSLQKRIQQIRWHTKVSIASAAGQCGIQCRQSASLDRTLWLLIDWLILARLELAQIWWQLLLWQGKVVILLERWWHPNLETIDITMGEARKGNRNINKKKEENEKKDIRE